MSITTLSDQLWPSGVIRLHSLRQKITPATPGTPRGASIAVGHETRALHMPREHVAQSGRAETAIDLLIGNAWSAGHDLDAAIGQGRCGLQPRTRS